MLQDRKSHLADQREHRSDASGEPPPGARALGDELAACREQHGWTLPAVAAQLRIRLPYLEALEAGRLGELPGGAYGIGFLRAYAALLGLDADELVRRFRLEAGEAGRRPELAFPAPVPQRGVPAGALVLLGLLVVVGAYVAWFRVSDDQRTPAQTVPPVPERLAGQAEHASRPLPPPSPQVASVLPGAAAPSRPEPQPAARTAEASAQPSTPAPSSAPPASAASAPAAAVGTPPSGAGSSAPASPVPAPATSVASPPGASSGPAGTASPAAAAQAGSPAAPAPADALPPGTRVVLKASAPTWVMVRERGGKVLLNKVLHPGDSFPVPPDDPKLVLSTGNARGLEIAVDGTDAPQLQGITRRDLPLDPDELRSGRLAAAPAPPAAPHPRPVRAAPGTGGDPDNSADALNAAALGRTQHP